MTDLPPTRRSAHRTQWAAQFAVASELCKRGYEVAFTTGNHPDIDLMAISPGGVSFSIDVKGQYRPNFWVVREKKPKPDLFYVLALVPDGQSNTFFIIDQPAMNEEIRAALERTRQRAIADGRDPSKSNLFPGVGEKFAKRFKEAWTILPK